MLLVDPRFEFPDRFALRRKLDVGVGGVNAFAAGMPHEGFADLLHHARFHESCIEGVAEIMEPVVTDPGPADGGLPGAFHGFEGTVFEQEDRPLGLWSYREEVREPPRERNLSSLTLRSFRAGHLEQPANEIDVLPPLLEDFASPHPGVERCDDDRAKMRRGCAK